MGIFNTLLSVHSKKTLLSFSESEQVIISSTMLTLIVACLKMREGPRGGCATNWRCAYHHENTVGALIGHVVHYGGGLYFMFSTFECAPVNPGFTVQY